MKTNTHLKNAVLILSIALLGMTSCEKENIRGDEELANLKLTAVTISSTAAVTGAKGATDSLYAMDVCKKGDKKVAVEFSALPSAIATYLTANYPGYTFSKAFQIADKTTASVAGFAVGIEFNGKPVAIKFDASGAFVKVLEIREGKSLKGKGFHAGGCFDNRDGKQRDTLALSTLPTAIKSYLTATYSGDTLLHAFVNKDQSVIVISKNVNYFATAFSSSSAFIKRIQLPAFPAKGRSIEASVLPASATLYLSTTYPNYVFKKAFEIKSNNIIKGYLVLIDANLTKYAVHFDANGQFVSVLAIR
ncbi:PepSY-like domain-containing protein [Daejeonella lutea]|uniref:Putative beta-lactamase-inhibitor-like, PepSY-like n=1 Tax=Daejeonella lutea TaxID=572036 RepID=A0A1T5F680_9SPHI|nr:PepSY-like domain-containing protein [Daejeonella lutea]SKB91683.1 Putative beta-lactamase-inhibitor-like, PepSY-like [Daejeonella lutea]